MVAVYPVFIPPVNSGLGCVTNPCASTDAGSVMHVTASTARAPARTIEPSDAEDDDDLEEEKRPTMTTMMVLERDDESSRQTHGRWGVQKRLE